MYWALGEEQFDAWNSTLDKDITLTAIWGKALEDLANLPKDSDKLYNLTENFVLSKDISSVGTIRVPKGANVVLDLNGHKLEFTNEGNSLSNYGKLTIIDSSKSETGIVFNSLQEKVENNYQHILVNNNGALTINGGTFGDNDTDKTNENKANLGPAIYNQKNATAIINKGNFSCHDGYWKNKDGQQSFSYTIRNEGIMTINNCNVYGKTIGCLSTRGDGTKVTINEGLFTLTGGKAKLVLGIGSNGKIEINGGTFIKTGEEKAVNIIGVLNSTWDGNPDFEQHGFIINGGAFIQDGVIKDFRPTP